MSSTSAAVNMIGVVAPARRVASIDIFRGLTILVMIFVNDLSGVDGLPWWTYHAHETEDVMTYVDMVFPFFLFIVGLSMPLAVTQRLKKNPSIGLLWLHVLSRSAGLIVLGLILANVEKADAAHMHLNPGVWMLLGLIGGILFWLVPGRDPRRRQLFRVLRLVGLGMLVLTFALFRSRTPNGHVAWIDGSYPEILGLIGYTYLAVAILYIPTRRWLWAPMAWTVALTVLCVVLAWGHAQVPLPLYIWPFDTGAMASITMAGIVTSTIIFGNHRWQSLAQRMLLAFSFALVCLIFAWILTPLGISKIRATPTWCLYSVGASVITFALLYWICDVQHKTSWAAFVRPAGENTLLTYLLPDLSYSLMPLVGFTYVESHFSTGVPGVARAIVFTLLMLAVSALLTRMRIRLQL